MGVPKEIREVERPTNTIVCDNGKDTPFRYAVRERAASGKYVRGKFPQPKNGKVIGHIINFKYVPWSKEKQKAKSESEPKESEPATKEAAASWDAEVLSYGAPAFAYRFCDDIISDLLEIYDAPDVYSIMVIAILRIIKPRISASRYASYYESSFLKVFFPGTHLSKNHVGKLLNELGRYEGKRHEFFGKRLERIAADHHIAIDGTLVTDNGIINELSQLSRKSRIKGTRDISVLYAYDIEKMEPVCADVFPGNSVDSTSYESFVRENNITKGTILADKGFPPNQIREWLKNHPDLHYITPVKRDDQRIRKYSLNIYDTMLRGTECPVMGIKAKTDKGVFLYSFKDSKKSAKEDLCFQNRALKKETLDGKKYDEKRKSFGTIVLESDLDLPLETAYQAYSQRWLLELVFKQYKNTLEIDHTSVQSSHSVSGSNFINAIASTITCRMLNAAKEARVLDHSTFGDMLDDLREVQRLSDGFSVNEIPKIDDFRWSHTIKCHKELMEKLHLACSDKVSETDTKGSSEKNSDNDG